MMGWLKRWWQKNIVGEGVNKDYSRDFSFDDGGDATLFPFEVPDFPEVPEPKPNQQLSVSEVGSSLGKSVVESFFIEVIVKVLERVIKSEKNNPR